MLNSIYEQRTRLDNYYHISLIIPREEYIIVYGDNINTKNALDIVKQYLQYKEDDGQPYDVKMYNHKISNMIEIEAKLNYIGNEHTDYEEHEKIFAKTENKIK